MPNMFSILPPHLPSHTQNPYYSHSPAIPSPLSSSPLRSSPSPLSSRNPNVPTSSPPRDRNYEMESPTKSKFSHYDFRGMSSPSSHEENDGQNGKREDINTNPTAMITPPYTSRRQSVYSKRTTKSNPLLHNSRGSSSSEEGRETRRKLFLKRVREGAEEKRFRTRGLGVDPEREEEEEMLRCIWLQEERKREGRIRTEAKAFDDMGGPNEELEMLDEEDERMADEVAMNEERELEYLLERMPSDQPEEMSALFSMENRHATKRPKTPYGSDDEEYDGIFMDIIEEEMKISSQQQRQSIAAYVDDQEMMDMS